MAVSKNPYRRYQILDSCFQNTRKSYTIDTLLQKVNETLEEKEMGDPISLRQLRNDISFMIGEWGLEFCQEKDGKKTIYRYADPSFSIYKQGMPEHQKEAIQTAIEFLQSYTDNHEMLSLLDMLDTANITVANYRETRKVIGLDLNDDYTGIEHKQKLANHIRERDTLTIEYQPFNAPEPLKYTFHPQFLKCYNNRWFLVGCTPDRPENITILSLDRIKTFKRNGKVKYIEMDQDWNEYFMDMIGVSPENEHGPEEVILHFFNNRGRYVETKPLHNSQKKVIEIAPGVHEVRLKLIINRELRAEILRFGGDVKVIAPEGLAEEMRKQSEIALRNYSKK